MRLEVAAARPRCPTVPALRSHFNQNEGSAPSLLGLSFVDTTELKISLIEGRVVRSLDRKVRNDKGSNWRVMILQSISKVAERYSASTMEQLAILHSCGGPSTIFTAFIYFLGGIVLQSTSTVGEPPQIINGEPAASRGPTTHDAHTQPRLYASTRTPERPIWESARQPALTCSLNCL